MQQMDGIWGDQRQSVGKKCTIWALEQSKQAAGGNCWGNKNRGVRLTRSPPLLYNEHVLGKHSR